MIIKQEFQNIIDDLQKYKRDKKTLLETYINDRLSKSLQTYYKELDTSFQYLSAREERNIIKKIGKD